MSNADRAPSLGTLARGGKPAMAGALAALERAADEPATLALLDAAYAAPRAQAIGVTGPPGVGKSTLLGRLVARFRAAGRSVGVIAVDPSSRRSGGALLGDRVRLVTDPGDEGVFVRSMAARDRLGGLAETTVAAMVVMRAVYDIVLIETVGVGQSETDVAGAADTVVFCVQPASGDSLQFMKAGIVEIPHIAVVTKADVGPAARRALADLKGALSLAAQSGPEAWPIETLSVSATGGQGLDDLQAALARRAAWLQEGNRLVEQRRAQAKLWLRDALRGRFGTHGLRRAQTLGLDLDGAGGTSPFARLAEVSAKIAL